LFLGTRRFYTGSNEKEGVRIEQRTKNFCCYEQLAKFKA
jgi:hypothetical protein